MFIFFTAYKMIISLFFVSLISHFGVKSLIHQKLAAGAQDIKVRYFSLFFSFPTFLPPSHEVPDCLMATPGSTHHGRRDTLQLKCIIPIPIFTESAPLG